ncbi:hypothetical protein SAMN05216480_10690 [Pustulibacterium marinum]|uniref:HipA-like C-terminal domain-containing protein n=1 Tax=Pustulibacterium marinum TaxID=1224947 RepID=A0A1I7GYB4_9FLAO|nr:hypothetical protein [Pustulibacterium marinum]SFU53385.1 hypothetical protein SAMN05216480_10690 [Pustulibacterium marinum]
MNIEKYIPTFTDISDWEDQIYTNTTGTRSKQIVKDPQTDIQHFFKGSKELASGEIRYPMEFWSEIASSKIGAYLGFNILDYNIAFNKNRVQQVGCLSASMVRHETNNLTEGVVYLTGKNSSYNPEKDKTHYTFQFILETLNFFKLGGVTENFIEMLVFDALIGNSDRHQENWGIITYFNEFYEEIEQELNKSQNFIKRTLIKYVKVIFSHIPDQLQLFNNTNFFFKNALKLQSGIRNEFAPIYDSGCCLGRECLDERVIKMLANPPMIDKYINRGKSEVHWRGKQGKVNHFELLELLQKDYAESISIVLHNISKKYEERNIEFIINNIDKNLPDQLNIYKLSDERKKLMIKLITLRFNKLTSLL